MIHTTIGIFAHIDSGKTTLTEQILYLAGLISAPGSIEDGTTESDSLTEEIQRGISIRSSFYSVPWKFQNHDYNLQIIDTPGHIDFRNQITDILPAIELAVVILESGQGVQSQARLIIEVCRENSIPIVFFMNKLDRSYDYLDCLIDLEEILGLPPVVLFQNERDTKNIVSFLENPDLFSNDLQEELIKWSDELLLDYWGLPVDQVREKTLLSIKGLSIGTLFNKVYSVYGGSAKLGHGVKDLLNLICKIISNKSESDINYGQFVLARRTHFDNGRYSVIYTKNQISFPYEGIDSKGEKYRIPVAYKQIGEDFVSIPSAEPSMLYIIPASLNLSSLPGNFIMSHDEPLPLKKVGGMLSSPFRINLEPDLEEDRQFWLEQLRELQWEDPSYVLHENDETGQLELWGRGELHLEVGVKRIQETSKKKLHLSSINIARFERFKRMTHKVALEHTAFENSKSSGTLTAFLEDTADFSKQVAFEVSLPEEVKNSIETAFYEATASGYHGYDVLGVRLRIVAFEAPAFGKEFLSSLLKVAVHIIMKEGFIGNTVLVGPLSEFEILVDDQHLGVVLSELSRRSAKVHSVDTDVAGKSRLKATASAENMLGFSGALRNMTKGIGISWERTAFSSEIYAVLKE
ncbi:MAG: elongation factor G-like protein [Leptospira sp.]|nr:elongation factor G-like protein [Leptospira sp.]